MQAAAFVTAVQERQGMMISCPEEIAYGMGFIGGEQLLDLVAHMTDNGYKSYLTCVFREANNPLLAAKTTPRS